MKLHNIILTSSLSLLVFAAISCVDTKPLDEQLGKLEDRVAKIQENVSATNQNALAIRALLDGENIILDHSETDNQVSITLSDGTPIVVTYGEIAPWIVPVLGIDETGRWTISVDGAQTFEYVKKTSNIHEKDGITPQIGVDADNYWTFSVDGGTTFERILGADGLPFSAVDGREVSGSYAFFKNVEFDKDKALMRFALVSGEIIDVNVVEDFYVKVKGYSDKQDICLGETLLFEAESSELSDAVLKGPRGWKSKLTDTEFSVSAPLDAAPGEYTVSLLAVSTKGYLRKYDYTFTLLGKTAGQTDCKIWNDFVAGNADNILLDYSYAGYKNGEVAPPDVSTLGYKTFNVCDYGAVPDDGISDRDAFINCLKAALGVDYQMTDNYIAFNSKPQANVVIYFPEGDYILHTASDNGEKYTRQIIIRSGNIVLKGAGRDKTAIVMQDPALPTSEELYSSPCMMSFYHFSGLNDFTTPVSISENAPKGAMSVKVSSTAGLSKGAWVCLWAEISDPDYIAAELAPYEAKSTWDISKLVKIHDYHQIASISGNEVTFCEPVMHAVDASKGFCLKKYNCYENVGVEDITFRGNCKHDYVHHGSWEDDGGFKPIQFMRCANSWVRRCNFESVSEAFTFSTCANCSGYDVKFTGWRGHAAMRSAGSSRIFIGATTDLAYGNCDANNPNIPQGTYMQNAGEFHAVGVNGGTMGTVIWRSKWGDDACFESHADQPRATLIDCCTGGWMEYRQGGGTAALPNHLADLTIWNFNSTTEHKAQWTQDGTFLWWATDSRSINYLPPIIVGFHGAACKFRENSVITDYSHGSAVDPESLYEAQIRARLGYVPSWLNSLK